MDRYITRIKSWLSDARTEDRLSVILLVATISSILVTLVLLTWQPPLIKDTKILDVFFNLDVLFLLCLAIVVAYKLYSLWSEYRSRKASSQIHTKIVGLFSLLAIAPTVSIAIFAALFFQVGIQGWFQDRIRSAVEESVTVARAYMGEHQKVISANAQAVAIELASFIRARGIPDERLLNSFLTEEVERRSLSEAIVFNSNMTVLGRSMFSYSIDFERIQTNDLEHAKQGPVIYTSENNDRVRALLVVDERLGIYLIVGRSVSPTVLTRVNSVEKAAHQYKAIQKEGSDLAFKFIVIFIGMAIMLLLTAIWGGLYFANKLARPIGQLIQAAERLRDENPTVAMAQSSENHDIPSLIRALQSAQRQAAWSDVARRIAHEIKNPLTPIQLSAERLKRRYLPHIENDPETFQNCIDTIIRQVGHIGSMVGEFSSFARMPQPQLEHNNLVKIVEHAIFLQSQATPKIEITLKTKTPVIDFLCDAQQIEQTLTNLLKNASEAILVKGKEFHGVINVKLTEEPNRVSIYIDDNGIGLPKEGRDRLIEPYITTREKGTGLGLAIVKRIVEDHRGYMKMDDNKMGGARISLIFTRFIEEQGKLAEAK